MLAPWNPHRPPKFTLIQQAKAVANYKTDRFILAKSGALCTGYNNDTKRYLKLKNDGEKII